MSGVLSGNSPFDRFTNGDRTALSVDQQEGLRVFRGKGNCTACHGGPTFTDERFHNTGIAWREPSTGSGQAAALADQGRLGVSGRDEDRGAFKTPTLREVTRTAPDMHDGSIATLEDVVDYYDRGGNQNPWLDREVRPLRLTTVESLARSDRDSAAELDLSIR